MKIKAFAKINLSLRVFEKRPDGFHSIESIMQSVSLHDLITISLIPSGIEVTCSDPDVPTGKDNLAYKAAKLFLGMRDDVRGVRVHIEKNIPMAAGLAGGSADAAAVLYGLNRMTNDKCSRLAGSRNTLEYNNKESGQMSNEGLLLLGSQIGSDVPFCLTGGTCLVKGRGEILKKQKPWQGKYVILACPDIQVSTKWAYEEFDRSGSTGPRELENDLEPVVLSRHKEIAGIKAKLLASGCSLAQMSGSGSAVFGVADSRKQAEEVLYNIKKKYPRSFLVEPVNNGLKEA